MNNTATGITLSTRAKRKRVSTKPSDKEGGIGNGQEFGYIGKSALLSLIND